jgi:hypothetical protein
MSLSPDKSKLIESLTPIPGAKAAPTEAQSRPAAAPIPAHAGGLCVFVAASSLAGHPILKKSRQLMSGFISISYWWQTTQSLNWAAPGCSSWQLKHHPMSMVTTFWATFIWLTSPWQRSQLSEAATEMGSGNEAP